MIPFVSKDHTAIPEYECREGGGDGHEWCKCLEKTCEALGLGGQPKTYCSDRDDGFRVVYMVVSGGAGGGNEDLPSTYASFTG